MRVAIKRAGKIQVDEIIEFEVQDNGDVILWTHEGMMDIIVHGMSANDIERATRELLYDGRTNLAMFEAEYDESNDNEDDMLDPQYEDEMVNITCVHCLHKFQRPASTITEDEFYCPHCGTPMTIEQE